MRTIASHIYIHILTNINIYTYTHIFLIVAIVMIINLFLRDFCLDCLTTSVRDYFIFWNCFVILFYCFVRTHDLVFVYKQKKIFFSCHSSCFFTSSARIFLDQEVLPRCRFFFVYYHTENKRLNYYFYFRIIN